MPDLRDNPLFIIRSREIWCTILCQSVSQLRSLYGSNGAETIMGNCDVQLVLAFQDNATTEAYAPVAGKTPDTLRATPLGQSWLFVRGQRPRNVTKYDLTKHKRYIEYNPYI